MLHVHADLMGASGFQPDGGKRKSVAYSQSLEMRDGRLAAHVIDNALDGAVMRARNRCANAACLRQGTGADGAVFAVDFPIAHLFRQNAGG